MLNELTRRIYCSNLCLNIGAKQRRVVGLLISCVKEFEVQGRQQTDQYSSAPRSTAKLRLSKTKTEKTELFRMRLKMFVDNTMTAVI